MWVPDQQGRAITPLCPLPVEPDIRPREAASRFDPGRVKTKSDLVVMLSGGQISAFFALNVTTSLKILGAVIPRNVFTQPRP
jgi:hypothetical protein